MIKNRILGVDKSASSKNGLYIVTQSRVNFPLINWNIIFINKTRKPLLLILIENIWTESKLELISQSIK